MGLLLLLFFTLVLGAATTALAEKCSDYPGGVIDGDAGTPAPGQLTIDRDCRILNQNPLTSNITYINNLGSFFVVFDNVGFVGNMSCDDVADHKIWFSNSSEHNVSEKCRSLFIPVEEIEKKNPAGQTTATIGVPFTYTLTLPAMSITYEPSPNDLYRVSITDDLTAGGADLTYVSHRAYLKGSDTPLALELDPIRSTTKQLFFEEIPSIPHGEQIVLEITVVLDDTARNAAGTQFTNTAKWDFAREIDGVVYEPLPGEWGHTEPMTIVAPALVVEKTGTTALGGTTLNLGEWGEFTLDILNTGTSDAWDITLLDRLPDGATGGMCDMTPQVGSVTLAGSPLSQGADYSLSYAGAPTCELTLTLHDAAGPIGPGEHLVVNYQTKLDANSQNGTLTNVAGATRWYNDASSNPSRGTYTGNVDTGTVGTADNQDAHTVTVLLSGYFFEKSVSNLSTGTSPATTAAPGNTLHYTLSLQATESGFDNVVFYDQLPVNFVPGSLVLGPLPAGAVNNSNPTTGRIDIGNLSVAAGSRLSISFDVTLLSTLTPGTVVINQAQLLDGAGNFLADSDDPNVNGQANPDPDVDDEDPTRVLIQTPPPPLKAIVPLKSQATIGEEVSYRITVPATPYSDPLNNVVVTDTLDPALVFVSAAATLNGAPLTIGTTQAGQNLSWNIASIPAGQQAEITLSARVANTAATEAGDTFTNAASYTYTGGVSAASPSTSAISVVEPAVTAATKTVRFITPAGKPATDSARVGDLLEYRISIPNSGDATAFDISVVDRVPANLEAVAGSATAAINGVAVTGFTANPATLPDGSLAWGRQNGDGTLDIPAGQSLVLTYRATVVSVTGAPIDNSVYVDWTSLQDAQGGERTGAGCPDITSPNDYCYGPVSATVSTLDITSIAKAVVDDSYAETPASSTDPIVRVGDTATYELTLNLQEYTTRNVVVEDALPAGMVLESFTVAGGPGLSYTLAAQPAAGAAGTLRWEFGDITNPPSNDQTPTDPLTIRYVARVVTAAPTAGVAYDPSILRANLAKLSYTGGDPALYPDRLTATATIDVRQPQMRAISKVDLGSGRLGTGAATDPYQVNIASEVMNFRLASCNDGLAPAYGVVITDQLAPEFDQSGLTAKPPLVRIGAAALVAGTHYTYTSPASGGEMRIAFSAPVNPGECVTIDYDLGFRTDIAPNQIWSNEARLPEYWSLPAQGRRYAAPDLAQVWMTNVARFQPLAKTLVSPAEATIGEEVVYQITVPAVPVNAVLNNVVVTDTLHGALVYESASAVDANGNPVVLTPNVAPEQVSLTIARIPAGQQAIITLRTRVGNNDQANAGSFANTASYTYAGMPAGSVTGATSGPLTIVEPVVTVSKTASTAAPKAGELLTYTLTFTAAGSGAGDNYSSAFDLTIEDSLGLGQTYEPGSATVNGAALADPLTNGADGASAPQTLTWDPANGVDIDIAEGATVTVTYRVRVLDDVSPGQTLTNSVVGRWTGLDGDQAALERTGSGTPVVNDYFSPPATLALTTPLAISFLKSVVNATTGEEPGANARPGDTLRYLLVVTNESIVPVNGAALIDELAAQFAPGSLRLLSVSDADADTTGSNAAGGGNGTGLVDIRNLTLGAQGAADDTLTIVFEATLAAVIANGTTVLNQAQLSAANLPPTASSQTSTLIASSPAFQVLKTAQDMTGESPLLMAGDLLRYTITVKNVGNENATAVSLRDLIPANTSYVADSTRLNGTLVADSPAGVSALENGLPVNAPEDTTPGAMRADANPATTTNVATITFEVRINTDVVDGTVIANQGFVNGLGAGGPFAEQPSNTTRNVVGNVPLIDAQKTVEIQTDLNGNGVADPGDLLLYTIRIDNFGAIPTTGVRLTDPVPAEALYVANSLRLNGQPVTNDGTSLVLDLLVSSPDQGPGSGIVSAGRYASVTFLAEVADVPSGTAISNQGNVASNELPTEPTDADGDPSNGNQPTLIFVGEAQELSISKEYQVVGGGPALPGATVEYLARVTNIGTVPALNVVITDSLAPPLGNQVTYVAGSATLNGSTANVSFAGTTLTATQGSLAVGSTAVLRFRVQIQSDQPLGALITNTAHVQWNTPTQTASASVPLSVGGNPGQARLGGALWHDANFNDTFDGGESRLAGWTVEIDRNGQRIGTTLTDADGAYTFSGLMPNEGTTDAYRVRFVAPGAGANSALLGQAHSPFTNGLHSIADIVAASGSNLQNLNLPIDPNGVIFNSITRAPVAGATVTLLHNDRPVDSSCFGDPAQQNQVTLASGHYKFDLSFSDSNPSCPAAGSNYVLRVTPPASGYLPGPSKIIPPFAGHSDPDFEADATPYPVSLCLEDSVVEPAGYCEAQGNESAPDVGVPPMAVKHYLYLSLNSPIPGASQIFNNHIPVDPELHGAVAITKTSALLNVTKGQLVPYTITATNLLAAPLYGMEVIDRFPAGFKYVQGSARLNGLPREPEIAGRELSWKGLTLQVNDKQTIQLLLVVGAGVAEGEYVNRAHVINTNSGELIGEDTATVRVIPDPTFDCTDAIGKVFDDRNLNGVQDAGEAGLPGVRVVTARGLIGTTDAHGRFHITCAVVPDEDRGSNFILKLDDRTLPTGYRLTTENPRVQRATRGKMLRFNFGATIHRVVAIDIADGVFEPETTQLRLQWQPKLGELLEALRKGPSVLRLSYLADVEREGLVRERLAALKKEIDDRWERLVGGYRLAIETEVFWRRGGPPGR